MDDYADDTRLKNTLRHEVHVTQHQTCDKVRACSGVVHLVRVVVHVIVLVVDLVRFMLVLSALVVILAVLIQFS